MAASRKKSTKKKVGVGKKPTKPKTNPHKGKNSKSHYVIGIRG